jgi:hypothetical protein
LGLKKNRHYNAVISARGRDNNYGSRYLRVVSVSYGINIAADEAETKFGGAFYPRRVDSASFTLNIIFTSEQERAKFGRWLVRYGRRISSPSNPYGPMRVIIPLRRFDRLAVPTTGIKFGDRRDQVTYPMMIPFRGARDPLSLDSEAISTFHLNKKARRTEARHFYPAADQLTGNKKGVDSLYDPSAGAYFPSSNEGASGATSGAGTRSTGVQK